MANSVPLAATERGAGPTPVTVWLPAVLVTLFPAAPRRLELPAATVGELIEGLDARFPGMGDRLCDSTPAIRRHINVFVAGRRAALETPVTPGSEIYIFTAMSGG